MPNVTRTQRRNFDSDLDEIAREGARRMLAQGWASLQRRRSAGKAKRGLTWSRGRVHIERTVG